MVYKDIADLIWNGLKSDMDSYSALDELEYIIEDLPVTDVELIKELNDKLYEQRVNNGLSECCGAEIGSRMIEECHSWLDDKPIYRYGVDICCNCGKDLD